jgi:DNA-binding Xre family transcriptional regulator
MFLDKEVVSNVTEYYEKIGITEEKLDWEETGKEDLVPISEINAIQEILACQVAFWCLRRTAGQSNSDTMMGIIRQKINFYEKTFGKEFHNFNEEIIY